MDTSTAHEDPGHPTAPTPEQFAPLSDVERRYIERVLDAVRWNQRQAARILGISRWSLGRRLRKFDMHRPARHPGPQS
jgi:DNA-binding NtrC family response regulator